MKYEVSTTTIENQLFYVVKGATTSGEDYILSEYAWQEFKENNGMK